jgi:tRNA (mo5U34)-methyltransferase
VVSPEELRARADALGWYHPIDLGQGVVTRGLSAGPDLGPDRAARLLRPESVLDIGAWDGYYSFQAERLGASRMVALDHYVWGVDHGSP